MTFNGFTQKFNHHHMLATNYTFLQKIIFSCLLLLIQLTNIKAQDAKPDLNIATILCDKTTQTVTTFTTAGSDVNEANTSCLENLTETSTTWFSWEATGDPFGQNLLSFTIEPNQAGDQFGFALFQLPNGLNDGTSKAALRCAFPCRAGALGLRDGENDEIIRADECATTSNSFMRPLTMTPGNYYGLMIENTTSKEGFTISFSGSGEFVGPTGEIMPDKSSVCFGETITFSENITFNNGSISQYEWEFEEGAGGAGPTTVVKAPQDFIYQTNGTKKVELTVTTDIGCTAVFKETIEINDCCNSTNQIAIEDNPIINEVNCPSDVNGSIDITVNNASPFPTIYEWSNNADTEDLSMLSPDTYTVTVSNAAGCRDSMPYELEAPGTLSATDAVVAPSCGGGMDGEIKITATGGRAPYEYDLGNDGVFVTNNGDFGGLGIGDYIVVVKDASGCTDTVQAIELDEKQLNITSNNKTDPSCNGLKDGSIEILADNAVGLLTYDFNDGNGPLDANSITTLSGGNYTINVFDSEGCTGNTVDFELTEPPLIVLNIKNSRFVGGISCTGANDGTAIVTASRGVPDYTYKWSTNETTRNISNLGPGIYTVTVTDANNCSVTNSTQAFEDPEPLLATITTINDASCFDKADGSIELNVTGGTASNNLPYKHTIDNITFFDGTTVTDLAIGDYTITITDNNDCPVEINGTINDPGTLTYSVSSNTDICYGESLSFSNTSTFTRGNITEVTWNFGDKDTIGANISNTFTTIGKPTVTMSVVTDLECSQNLTEELNISVIPCCNGNNSISVVPNSFDPLCNNGSDGSISLAITSAPAVTAINWADGQTGASIDNLSEGSYEVTVTNDATCDSILTITINEPSEIIPTLTITEPTCEAASNGEIIISATGGTPGNNNNYDYDFNLGNNFSSINMETGLSVGIYDNIQVRDDNNCIGRIDTFLAVPDGFNPITASLAITIPTCEDATNGSITVNATGDGRPLLYNFGNGPSTDNMIPNLDTGFQTIIVQDLDNCTLNLDTSLTVAADAMPIQANVQINQPSCSEATNGSITIMASGNGGPFQYNFGNDLTPNNMLSDTTIGNYSIEIRDSDGCSFKIDTALAVAPDAMPVQATLQIVQPSCGGATDGSVTILPSGELGTNITNYTYDFGSGFSGNNVADNLGNVQFFAVIKNANNCSMLIDTILNELVLSPTMPLVVRPTCFGLSDGSIVIDVPTPGQGPFMYNFGEGNGFQDASALTNLPEGNYNIQVQDINQCLSDTLKIVVDEPDELMVSLDKTDISCFGNDDGRIVATVTGGVGNNTYNWNNGQTGRIAENLTAGDYMLDVTDGNDCPISSNTVEIIEPAELSANIPETDDVLCFGEMNGAITVTPIGGSSPYEYSLDGIIFQSTPTLENLAAGSYNVIVKDSRDCEITTQNATVGEPGEFIVSALVDNETTKLGVAINLSAEAVTTATGGINYTWSTPDSIVCSNCENFETVPPGSTIYTLTAVNSDNCQASSSVSVAVSTDRPIYFPNIFTPNGDGVHDEFYIPFSPAMETIKEFKIFDRSGALVYEAFDIKRGEEISKAWNGEFNGTKIRQGVFIVSAQIIFVDKQVLPYQSDITLITSE